jgi:cytochrome c oxidase assembly protein subunit 15
MKTSSKILFYARFALVMMFLVIIAGSVVRMSGSGMGCPDWPKCFGYLIPPTDAETLHYYEGREFTKGQMVILNDTLWTATESFKASSLFDHAQWQKYPNHDYAVFNVTHTWIEYVNRLVGALSGIPTLILFVLSFMFMIKHRDVRTFILATLVLFMLGFEAWLGKTVVDAELQPVKITIHMLGAVVLVALLLMMIARHKPEEQDRQTYSTFWKVMSLVIMVLAFAQIFLGTQVREAVDVVASIYPDRFTWIENLPTIFKVHRSFSILVVILLIVLFKRSKGLALLPTSLKGIFIVALLEVMVGVILAYAGVPMAAQPIHLFLGILWFAFAWYFLLQVWRKAIF